MGVHTWRRDGAQKAGGVLTEGESRRAFRLAVVRQEAPRGLIVAGMVFGLVTVLNSQVGPTMAIEVLLVNVTAALVLIAAGLAVRRPSMPAGAGPWILALGALMLMLIGLVEVWMTPDAVAFLYLVMIIVIYPLLTLAWTPAVSVAVPMLVGCVLVATGRFAPAAPDWIIASVAAVTIGMALLWLRMRTVNQLADTSAMVGKLATRDRLTSALNRHGVQERIPDLLGLATRHHEQVFAVFADVDGLKAVNDEHGHAVGDAVLVATADAIRGTMRATDLVGRWGGDEFIVLGMGHIDQADALSERVRQNIRTDGFDPDLWAGTISVGVAVASLPDVDVEALIRKADDDMYSRRRIRRAGGASIA